jgi:hypothetical protein
MVSFDGTAEMLGANAHIVQAYFPTCVSAFMQCNRANGGGKNIRSHLQKYLKR